MDNLDGKNDDELSRMSAECAGRVAKMFMANNDDPRIAVTAMAAVLGSTCRRFGIDPGAVIRLFAEMFNQTSLVMDREAAKTAAAMADDVDDPDVFNPEIAARVLDELAEMVKSHGQARG